MLLVNKLFKSYALKTRKKYIIFILDSTFDVSFSNTFDSFLTNSKIFKPDNQDKPQQQQLNHLTLCDDLNGQILSSNRSSSASSASSVNTNLIKTENIEYDDQNQMNINYVFQNKQQQQQRNENFTNFNRNPMYTNINHYHTPQQQQQQQQLISTTTTTAHPQHNFQHHQQINTNFNTYSHNGTSNYHNGNNKRNLILPTNDSEEEFTNWDDLL
jgi:hypothetical protein